MAMQYEFQTVSEALPVILSDLLEYGDEVGSRNGRVKELLNTQITINHPTSREVLSLNRKANVFAQIAETMWVLAGRNDVKWLSAYLPRAVDYSDDGETWRGGYGPRIRSHFGGDQLAYVIDTLTLDPLSRRAVIGIYDADVDIPAGKDVPCNDFLQFQSRNGYLFLTVTVRSNDAMWGWSGINAFEWSTLQEIVASLLGINVGPLVFNIGSLHLYDVHWDKARRIEHEPVSHDTIQFDPKGFYTTLEDVDLLLDRWFVWEDLCRKGEATKQELLSIEEPMFRSWAAAIAYYWDRDDAWREWFSPALAAAVARTPASVLPEPVQRSQPALPVVGPATTLTEGVRAFYEFARDLHAVKHASYGDSWRKRGEKMSILANIARKVDRLGVGDEFDSSTDTAIDLWVYLAKYLCWLTGKHDDPSNVNLILEWSLGETEDCGVDRYWESSIPAYFDHYADNLDQIGHEEKIRFIRDLLKQVAPIARDLWLAEQGVDEYRGADRD